MKIFVILECLRKDFEPETRNYGENLDVLLHALVRGRSYWLRGTPFLYLRPSRAEFCSGRSAHLISSGSSIRRSLVTESASTRRFGSDAFGNCDRR